MFDQASDATLKSGPVDPGAMKVSAIVVTIKALSHLAHCLDSLFRQTHPCFEIILIDNSTCPGSNQELKQRYPAVKVYTEGRNLFYTGGLNRGIGVAAGEFILCLNDDVVLEPEFIQKALEGFFAAPRVGMVSGKILRWDKKTLDSTGLLLSPWRTARERGYGQVDRGQFDQSGLVFGVSGAVAFYRKAMLEEVRHGNEYFDPRFLMFYEDLDLAWRAQRMGWQAYYVCAALGYHQRGGSFRPPSGIGKPFARRYLDDRLHARLIKNRYRTIVKNETWKGLFWHLVPMLIYDLAVWGYVLCFRPGVFKQYFMARKDFDN